MIENLHDIAVIGGMEREKSPLGRKAACSGLGKHMGLSTELRWCRGRFETCPHNHPSHRGRVEQRWRIQAEPRRRSHT
jgi:hypothetical protein